jgi:hypothetical protein
MPTNALEYQGNPGLGIGSNPNIPVAIPDDLKVINETARDIMLVDNERNLKIFQQKVADRDNLTSMILQDQVPRGNILPNYFDRYDEASKRAKDAFAKWGGNFNDIEGYAYYKNTITDLRDVAAHALTNTVEIQKLRQQQAKELLPEKKKKIGDYIDSVMKQDFWNVVKPYQELYSFNIDDMNSGVRHFKTVTQDKDNPLLQYDESYVDFDDVLQNKRDQFVNDEGAAVSMKQFYTMLQQYSEPDLKKQLDSMDSRIDKYNTERGFKEGGRGYVPHVQRKVVDDHTIIKEPITDFSAKYALAHEEQYVTRTPKFNKALADYTAKQQKLSVDWYNAKTRRMLEGLRARQLDNADDDTKQFSQVWDNIGANIQIPSIPLTNVGSTEITDKFKVNVDDLPEGFTYLNGINGKGQPIQLIGKDAQPVYGGKGGKDIVGYKGGYFDANYFMPAGTVIQTKNGPRKLSKDRHFTSQELYGLYQDSGYKGNFDDFIKDKYNSKELDYQLEGQNGKANRVSSYISQKALGNKLTKKGQSSPFTPDELGLMSGVDDSGTTSDESEPQDN